MRRGDYEISTDPARLDRDLIHCFLSEEAGDVFIVPAHRGRGLGKWLVETVMAHPDLQGLRRFMLGTEDAHSLYERFGFRPLANPDRMMEITVPYEGREE